MKLAFIISVQRNSKGAKEGAKGKIGNGFHKERKMRESKFVTFSQDKVIAKSCKKFRKVFALAGTCKELLRLIDSI